MSAELTLSISGSFLKNNLTSEKFGSAGLTRTVSGKNVAGNTGTATTGDASLPLGALSTAAGATLWIKNNDPTNNLLLGPDGSSYPNIVAPLFQGCIGWNAAAVHYKSSASTVDFQWHLIEA